MIYAKFDNPMNDYMALMQAARKAEGEHKQEKCNNFCASKSGVVSDVPSGHEDETNPDLEAPTQEPWAKWVEIQQQLMATVKGTQNVPKKTEQQGSNWGQRQSNQNTSSNRPRPQRQGGNWNTEAVGNSQKPGQEGI